jgi:V/A-type H+-transporting ATPase subunit C
MDTRYTYITGRIRALETRLLDKLKLERMAAAGSLQNSLRELAETDYGISLARLKDINSFTGLLSDELKKLYLFIDKWSLDEELTNLFRMRYDFHNLKVYLKNSFREKPLPPDALPFIDLGLNDPSKVEEAKEYIEICNQVRREFEKSRNPQSIDIVLDQKYYAFCVKKAREFKNKFLIEFFRIEIDLTNIKMFFRCRTLKKPATFFAKVFIDSGLLHRKLFMEFYGKEESTFLNKLYFSPYAKVIDGYQRQGLGGLELACDNFLLEYVKKSKFVTAGLEVLISYLVAKENEVKLLRTILVGKINELSLPTIREKIRESFV